MGIVNHSEICLLDRLKHGDIHAYGEIFKKFYSSLCTYAFLYIRDRELSENIVQDLMLYLWDRHASLNISSLSGYLFNAVRNNCLKYLERESIEKRVLEYINGQMQEQFENPDFYTLKELKTKLSEALEDLPKTYRESFELNRFHNKTYNEIANSLNVSAKTVDYRIQQTLKILRDRLKDFLPLFIFFAAGLLD